ncbi:MAG: 2-hydroxychromene-2-carboxylate isomerase [Rubrobacteraceae bacterium]
MADGPKLEFWFEFGSTYSHLSAARIEGLAAGADVEVSWKPFLLGPIFSAQGWDNSPFNIYPAKGRYMWRDVQRRCKELGVPFEKPSVFPRNGLLAARVANLAKNETWMPEFARLVFVANFAEDRDISDRAVIEGVLESLGLPGATLIERSQDPENKQELRDQTELAVELGIFGAPSFVVGDELFWGDDRLEKALGWASRAGP